MTEKQVDEIVKSISTTFSTFGGGRNIIGNPVAHYLSNKPPMFAMGVDVKSVVMHVLKMANKKRVSHKSKHL